MVHAPSYRGGTGENEKRYVIHLYVLSINCWGGVTLGVRSIDDGGSWMKELRLESQKRLKLFIRDPGEIRCHSDLLILQQDWTLTPCLQKDQSGLLVPEKTHDDRVGLP
ncbi:hypothetical protein NDU88_006253 [Pleurodeles waltl]|uniref:Uncharacterized protein n=1 Tax=Pleurodeles waltl TaxID=8319 RepID=A0AAV7PIA2_PLEWA|nr:hypothetical protein NDU88_006253 [Pleurodeles waltl]